MIITGIEGSGDIFLHIIMFKIEQKKPLSIIIERGHQ